MNTVVRLPIQGEQETVAVDAALAQGHTLVAFRITQDHPECGVQAGDIGIVGTSRWEGSGRPMLLGRGTDVVCWRADGSHAIPGTPLGWLLLTVEDAAAPDDRMRVIHHLGVVPDFSNEVQEAEFWATHGLGGHMMSREQARDLEHLLPPVRERLGQLARQAEQELNSDGSVTILERSLLMENWIAAEPGPIETEDDNERALAEVEVLCALAGEDLTHPASGYIQALIARIVAYEARAYPTPDPAPHEMLKFLLENREMSEQELAARLDVESQTVRALFQGELEWSDDWTTRLSEVLGVNREVFISDSRRES